MNIDFLENLQNAIEKTIEVTNDRNINLQGGNSLEEKLNLKDAKYTLDRIEENVAVLENRETREMLNVDKKVLPKEAKEGDVLKYSNGTFKIDKKETKAVEDRVIDKANRLWK